ncbi:MAG: alanine--tRNA ligase [Methyloceanibacter sp.]|uniref:alanine--tRNA ligase n=1 Tax=Methyloceanibacter sp. TaxID=1965321 RepID=UPI003D9AD37F
MTSAKNTTAKRASAAGRGASHTSVNDIRAAFLDFFRERDHEIVPSSPLVPRNDPTLMFTNAGMVPFKNVFTGAEKPSHPRAASSQKCVRAGGKHNDLDNVGYTARHHTFFEMLGNFSFGDYFKERAILLAWDLITKDYALNKDRLLITVFADDEEAAALWRKISGFPDSKILRIAGSDNFWSMGDTGPCGPCSEIFYDHGPALAGGPPGSADADGDRFVEIWNLVFMQYEQRADGSRVDLPRPSIDTGMGLERIAAVLQGTHDNYAIDLFRALIGASVDLTGVPAEGAQAPSHRVIADHLRASSFLIADGVLPSNEGRGYVLRRIMRRAMRHAQLLGSKDPLLHRLVPVLVDQMGRAFPELDRGQSLIEETLKLEETRFRDTLERGLRLLDDEAKDMKRGDVLPGEIAFKLYDTYGFPFDLTEDALKAKGIGIDAKGFAAAMERQRAEARKSWAGSGEAQTETLWFELKDEIGATEFLGYETETASAEVVALIKDGKRVKELRDGERGSVVVNQTPFYGESGGQVGDHGRIFDAEGLRFTVEVTHKKLGSLFLHSGVVEKGRVQVRQAVELEVDHGRRTATRAHHSATHIVHEALRRVLGPHVAQKGSLVEPGRLRFDFSHQKPMTHAEIRALEDIANTVILQNDAVETHLMAPEEAIAKGALALFGEKYGEEVRVVSMGKSETSEKARKAYSIELCGGTHVRRTGDIGLLKIVSESPVASGVRRIEALTGEPARLYLAAQEERVREAAEILKVAPDEVITRLAAVVDERRKLERQLTEAKRELALRPSGGGGESAASSGVRELGGIKLLARTVQGVAPKDLRGLVDDAKRQLGSGIVAIAGVSEEGKAGLVVGVTDDLTATYDAVELARIGAEALGGKGGGGRRDLAQAGGPDGGRADAALEAIAARLGEGGVGAPEPAPGEGAKDERRAGRA